MKRFSVARGSLPIRSRRNESANYPVIRCDLGGHAPRFSRGAVALCTPPVRFLPARLRAPVRDREVPRGRPWIQLSAPDPSRASTLIHPAGSSAGSRTAASPGRGHRMDPELPQRHALAEDQARSRSFGSRIVTNWFAATSPTTCVIPLGHRISSEALDSPPSPKCSHGSLQE